MSKENKIVEVRPRAIKPKQEESSIDSLMAVALQNNAPVEVMERLFALHKDVKAEKAKEEFVKALAQFQSECPAIEKTKKVLNKDGRSVRYQYAPLDAIIDKIKKPLSENGLSYSWNMENKDGFLTAIVKITHKLGHSETSSFEIPIDKEGFMTAPQKYASAQTFAKRYALCNALGIYTGEEDTDATDVGDEPNAKSEKSKIVFLLKTLKQKTTTKEDIEKAVSKLANLPLIEKNFSEIVSRLEVLVKEQNEDNSIQ